MLPHKLPPNRQRQQRRLQRCEYLFQDYPKFALNCQRFAVFNILQGRGCQRLSLPQTYNLFIVSNFRFNSCN
jgi:hypothetical protein